MRKVDVWLGVLWAVALALIARFWFVCDDAFITWRYAKNWVDGHGIRFNLGDDPPVEGYSNFLWLVVAAGFEALGADLTLWVPLVSVVSALALVAVLWWSLRTHFDYDGLALVAGTASLALSMPFAVWASSGLATMPFALAVFLYFERTVLSASRWAWLHALTIGLVLALLRTEGIAWVGVVTVLAIGVRWRRSETRELGWLGGVVAGVLAVYAVYYGWRLQHFGTWVSNTALVKVHFGPESLVRGLKYLALYHLVFLAPLVHYLGMLPLIRRRGAVGLAVGSMALAFPAYALAVGGDYMTSGRLLVPSLAFCSVLFASLVAWASSRMHRGLVAGGALAVLIVGLVPALGVQIAVPKTVHERLHIRLNTRVLRTELKQWEYMSKNAVRWGRQGQAIAEVAPPGARMEHSTIGAVGYYSGIYLYDRAGLVTREVAERDIADRPLVRSPGHDKTVPRYWFAKDKPTYLRAIRVKGWAYKAVMIREVRTWRVPHTLQTSYVPDFYELSTEGAPAFLLVLRRLEEGEEAEGLWQSFPDRLKTYELQNVEEEPPQHRARRQRG